MLIVPIILSGAKVLPAAKLLSLTKPKEISVPIRSEGVTATLTFLLLIAALPFSKTALLVIALLATSKVIVLG